jgi:hypothetical protein
MKAENLASWFLSRMPDTDPLLLNNVFAVYSDEVEDFADLASQTWNGGVGQWLENRYGPQLRSLEKLADKIGDDKFIHFLEMIRDIVYAYNIDLDDPDLYADNNEEVEAEIEADIEAATDYFYTHDDAIVKTVADYFIRRYTDAEAAKQ